MKIFSSSKIPIRYQMKQLNKFQNILYRVGAVLLLVGLVLFFIGWDVAATIYLIGCIFFTSMQMYESYEGQNVVIRRLRRQQIIGAVFLLLSGVLMFLQHYQIWMFQRNEWLLGLAIASLIEIYTAWRIPAELEKEKRTNP
jgi:hypothetical protein